MEKRREWYITIFGTRLVKGTKYGLTAYIYRTQKEYEERIKENPELREYFSIIESCPRVLVGIRITKVVIVGSDYKELIIELCDKTRVPYEVYNNIKVV